MAATALVVAALFVPQVVGALYEGLERELPKGFPVLSQVFLVLSLTAWFFLYSQKQHVSWVMDMGWFLLVAWIIVIPYYTLKHEGRSGLARIGLFCLSWFAAWATGRAVLIWTQVLAT